MATHNNSENEEEEYVGDIEIKTPTISFGWSQGSSFQRQQRLAQPVLMLSGIDKDAVHPPKLFGNNVALTTDLASSFLFDPEEYNKGLEAETGVRHDSESSWMNGFRDAVDNHKRQHGTRATMMTELSVSPQQQIEIDAFYRFTTGQGRCTQIYNQLEFEVSSKPSRVQ